MSFARGLLARMSRKSRPPTLVGDAAGSTRRQVLTLVTGGVVGAAARPMAADAQSLELVNTSTNQTINGIKTFTQAPVVPAGAFPRTAVVGLDPALASKAPRGPAVYLSSLTPADGRNVDDVKTTNGSNVITSAKAQWTAADVGKPITVGNGSTSIATRTTIAQFDSPTQVRVGASLSFTTTGDPVGASWGTDAGPAMQAALDGFLGYGAATLVVDGPFFVRTPVSKSYQETTYRVEVVGEGNGAQFIIDAGPDSAAITLTNLSSAVLAGLSFVGTKWVAKDAAAGIVLASCVSRGLVQDCNFYGLSAGDGATLRFVNAVGIVEQCGFGGCGTGTGAVIHFSNFMAARMRDVSMIDFAYTYGNQYSTANTTGTPGRAGNAWIWVDDPQETPKFNASSQAVVDLRHLLLDEAPINAIVIAGNQRRIEDVRLHDIQINGAYSNDGRGVKIRKTDRVRVSNLWAGYRSTPVAAPIIELLDAGVVRLEAVRRGDIVGGGPSTMNKITADAATTSLELVDCSYTTLAAACPVSIRNAGRGAVVARAQASGAVSDADFDAKPPDGTIVISGTDLYLRNVGQWIKFGATPTVPGAPGTPVATEGNQKATLTWTAPVDNGNSIPTGYVITPYIGTAAQAEVNVGDILTTTVTGLTNGTTYTFRVAQVNATGVGPQSAASNPVTPGFSPLDVPNLAIWLKADVLSLTNGDVVPSWTDSSGNGRPAVQATSARQPTFRAAVLNGKPVVRFDGVDDFLRTVTFPLVQPNTTFIVCKWAATTSLKAAHDGYTNSKAVVDFESGAIRLYAGTAVRFSTASTAWRLLNVTWNGPATVARAEGGAGVTLNPGTGAMNGLTLGSQGMGSAGYAAIDIAEVIEFSRQLTADELNRVGNYLAAKYGLTWTAVP